MAIVTGANQIGGFAMVLHMAQNKNSREISNNNSHDIQIYLNTIYTNTSKYTKQSTEPYLTF